MGQFGMSLSQMDARLIALGRIGSEAAWPVIIEKATQLDGDSEFSHFRAIAEACEGLYPRCNYDGAAEVLSSLLKLPGVAGHARVNMSSLQSDLTDHTNETGPRNLALRELHLARALYRCGDDSTGTGRDLLSAYARDLRGHFAKHAAAVLGEHEAVPRAHAVAAQ